METCGGGSQDVGRESVYSGEPAGEPRCAPFGSATVVFCWTIESVPNDRQVVSLRMRPTIPRRPSMRHTQEANKLRPPLACRFLGGCVATFHHHGHHRGHHHPSSKAE